MTQDTRLCGVSATHPDWSREKLVRWWDPSRQLLRSIRQYQRWCRSRSWLKPLMCRWNVLQYRFWTVVTATDIPLNCKLGGGLLMPHPTGIVIHNDVEMGPNCLILQQVTISQGVKIGGHVDIGAGAKIIRPVTIGDHAQIGANAVVLFDVPPGATAVGVPAKIIDRHRVSQMMDAVKASTHSSPLANQPSLRAIRAKLSRTSPPSAPK